MPQLDDLLKTIFTTNEIVDSLARDLFESIEAMDASNVRMSDVKKSLKGSTNDISTFMKKLTAYSTKMGKSILTVRDKREGREGDTLLHAAAKVGNLPVAAFLMENGLDVNAVDTSQTLCTPIFKAVVYGWFDLAYLLAKNGADLMHTDFNGENIFHYVARKNSAISIKEIANHGNLGQGEIQFLAGQARRPDAKSFEKKKYPEQLAPEGSICYDILHKYRTEGLYVSIADSKKIKAINESKKKSKSGKWAQSRRDLAAEMMEPVPENGATGEAPLKALEDTLDASNDASKSVNSFLKPLEDSGDSNPSTNAEFQVGRKSSSKKGVSGKTPILSKTASELMQPLDSTGSTSFDIREDSSAKSGGGISEGLGSLLGSSVES